MDEVKRRKDLKEAYQAIFLAYFHHQIDRNEREARVVALRDTLGAGLSFEERDAVANEAVRSVALAAALGQTNRPPSPLRLWTTNRAETFF
jgi:hypothetical protein